MEFPSSTDIDCSSSDVAPGPDRFAYACASTDKVLFAATVMHLVIISAGVFFSIAFIAIVRQWAQQVSAERLRLAPVAARDAAAQARPSASGVCAVAQPLAESAVNAASARAPGGFNRRLLDHARDAVWRLRSLERRRGTRALRSFNGVTGLRREALIEVCGGDARAPAIADDARAFVERVERAAAGAQPVLKTGETQEAALEDFEKLIGRIIGRAELGGGNRERAET